MTKFFLKIYDSLAHRRFWAAFLVVLIVGLCLFSSLRVDYQEDISAFLPMDENTKDYTQIYTHMGGQDQIVVVFSNDRFNAENDEGRETFIEAMECFCEVLKQQDTNHCIANIQSNVDESSMLDVMSSVWTHYPLMLSSSDLSRIDSMLYDSSFVGRQMESNHEQLMLPTSGLMQQSLASDPLHFSSSLLQSLQQAEVTKQYSVADGYIFSKDGKRGLVFLNSTFGTSESDNNKALAELIERSADSVMQQFEGMHVSAIGAPLIAVSNAMQIRHDSFFAVSLSVILIMVLLIYVFRRFSDIMWIGSTMLFGWLVAVGLISLLKDNLSIIVLGIGSVIIGIAVNYPLHFLDHLRHENNRRNTLREMVEPLLVGNITTVSAFLCLVFLDADAMKDLGLFGSFMLVGTILFSLCFLPVFVRKYKTQPKIHYILPKLHFTVPASVRKCMHVAFWVLSICFGYLSLQTSFDANMHHINYLTEQQRHDMEFLQNSVTEADSTSVVFAAIRGNDMQQALRKNEELLDRVAQDSRIYSISSISSLLPSDSAQVARHHAWKALWQKHTNSLADLQESAAAYGFSSSAFDPFMKSVSDTCSTIDVETQRIICEGIGKRFIQQEEDGVTLVSYLHVDKASISSVKEAVRVACPAAFVFDAKDVSTGLVDVLSDSFNYVGFVCSFVVFFFLWLSYGRLELSVISFLPLAVAWVWILGFMQLCGIQFNIVNIILATFIFGQGDDYSIFITEGLMYEHAYGRKRLLAYKNSVALSAILMFVGIGTLIFAKHPAMKSLAEVTIIGMLTVVLMTYYLPPITFRWLTTKKGVVREVPLTFKRIIYSLWALLFFLFNSMFIFVPYTLIHRMLPRTDKRQLFFHRVLQLISRFVIKRVPGVKFVYKNEVGERFEKPAVIICNHQSHLDVMAILQMDPKIIILTNDWVWKNPFYGHIIHTADFIPVSDGMDKNMPKLRDLVDRGYSVVVFPEGTRETGRSIMRFHKGAFALAQALNIDVLPVCLHGLTDVMPKSDMVLREGQVTLEVFPRMTATELAQYTDRELRSMWGKKYVRMFGEMCSELDTIDYCSTYVKYQYFYKGAAVERRCRRILSRLSANADAVESFLADVSCVHLLDSGQGEVALTLSLSHPNIQFVAYEADEMMYDLASNLRRPANLTFVHADTAAPNEKDVSISVNDLINRE